MTNISDPDPVVLSTAPRGFPWATAAKIAAAASAVGGVLLHLIGATANQAYYEQWGLDPAMFPKATDLTLVLGYQAMLGGFAKFVGLVIRDYWPWLLGYGIVMAFSLWGAEVAAARGWFEPVRSTLVRREKIVRIVTGMVISIALFAIAVPVAISAAFLAVAGPLTIGDAYGRQVVEEQLSDFQLGCCNLAARARCATVTRNGDLVGQGYLIGASETHVALFSAESNRTMVVERAGAQIVGAPRLTAYPKNWPTAEIK